MIEIKNLDFGYKNQNVFKNISLNFEKGNIYGLLGENGVGKTTLLKLISGLQKPTAGECLVDEVASFNRWPETLQKIFFISEDFAIPEGTPINNIKELAPFYPNYNEAQFMELCKEMEVDPTRKFGDRSSYKTCFNQGIDQCVNHHSYWDIGIRGIIFDSARRQTTN